jgi:hypothetical protein
MTMSIWRVEGMARIEYQEYCGCEWCQGHDAHNDVLVQQTVEGVTEEEALDAVALTLTEGYVETDRPRVTWVSGPVVAEIEYVQDRLMRAAGQPTLPGMT